MATPVAFESFGVRSMCTYVESPDVRILIDPGVALGPRFRLFPHPREYEALMNSRRKIRKYARIADVLVVSHYHHDHFTPNFTDTTWLASNAHEADSIYRGKIVMVKDVRSSTNLSQRRRGWIFQTYVRKIARETIPADGRTVEYGGTTLRFSAPLPHGEERSELGWVIATIVEFSSEKLIHASDLQGPMSETALRFILNEQPSAIIVGGPPTYLGGVKASEDSIKRGMKNLETIAKTIPLVIVDHHLLRSQDSIEELSKLSASTKPTGHSIMTASEYVGHPPELLEANRRSLYDKQPPPRRFMKWTKLREEKQRQTVPPLEPGRRKKGGGSESP